MGTFRSIYMSSNIVGYLFSASVISLISQMHVFFLILTIVSLLASVTFLFLREPTPQPFTIEPLTPVTEKQSLAETVKLFFSERIMALQGLFLASGFNESMATLFIPLMVSHMQSMPRTEAYKDRQAMLAMVCVGVGEIIGSAVFGRIQDNHSMKAVVVANVVVLLAAFGLMIAFHLQSEFSFWLACMMTLAWGF